ncbi:MAG TPA: hypothetical protein DFS52_26140 [Myxococcales bacterium]|jgi:hypothetical protein|nr:hypothetical protein [Myxococcales bacterium]
MLPSAILCLLLASSAGTTPQPNTVWLVQPLYPGQELLVSRTQEALGKLMASEEGQLVGTRALAAALQGKRPSLDCLIGEAACSDPVDSFIASLGLERIVMLRAGHEELAYRCRVTSYLPQTGERAYAEGTGASLERALIAALIKVVPLASTIEVASVPQGATLFIDGEKVGVTPYSGQILPGERKVKLELASHVALEKVLDVPVRGALVVSETLEKNPARLVIAAGPEGAGISVDGKRLGTDKVEQTLRPGKHRIVLDLEGFVPLAEEIEIQPGQTLTLERRLEPTGWTAFRRELTRAQEQVYSGGAYFQVSYEQAWLHSARLGAQGNPLDDTGPLARRLTNEPSLSGLSFEYGHDGRYFGLMAFGAGYYHSTTPFAFTLERAASAEGRADATAVVIRALQPHLRVALWRFSLVGQLGLEARVMILNNVRSGDGRELDDLYLLDLQGTAQIGLRAQIVAGLYLEGIFRHSWTLSETSGFQGFHVGVGYAF